MGFYFVSHKSSDDEIVTSLHDHLKAKGIDTWVDHITTDSGDRWPKEIQQALNTCDAAILALTSDAADSRWVEGEVLHLFNLGKTVHVALIEELSKEDYPFYLGAIQRVDLSQDFEAGIAELVKALKKEQPESPRTIYFPGGYQSPPQLGLNWVKVTFHLTKDYFLRAVNTMHDYARRVGKSVHEQIENTVERAKVDLEEAANQFQCFLARVLGIPCDKAKVRKLKPGSLIVEVWLPLEAAERLTEIARNHSSAFGTRLEEFSATLDTSVQLTEVEVDAMGFEIEPALYRAAEAKLAFPQIQHNPFQVYSLPQLNGLAAPDLMAYRGQLISMREEKQGFLQRLVQNIADLLTGGSEKRRAEQEIAALNQQIAQVNNILITRHGFNASDFNNPNFPTIYR